jgi:hypothetical protein
VSPYLAIDDEEPEPKPGHVWITHSRLDDLFLPTIPATAFVGALSWWLTGNARFLSAPLGMATLWVILRWIWPREGALVPKLAPRRDMIPVLWWYLAWALIGLVEFGVLDVWLQLPPKVQSMTGRQIGIVSAFSIGWLAVLPIVGSWLEHQARKPEASDDPLRD